MRHISFRALIALVAITTTLLACRPAIAAVPQSGGIVKGTVLAVNSSSIAILLDTESGLRRRDLSIANFAAQTKLVNVQPKDLVTVTVDNRSNPSRVITFDKILRPVSKWARIIAFGVAFSVLFLIAAFVTKGNPQKFLIGVDNRYSNSQCQLALWFGVVATVYLAAVSLRVIFLGWDYIGGVGLSQNLIALTGLSSFTFGGAKVITAKKVLAAEQANSPPPKVSASKSHLLTDLVQNDRGAADLGDFEMILIALATALLFLLSAFHFLGSLAIEPTIKLPDVDSTLLAGFGLGHGAYLVKKAALKAGEG